MERYLCRGLMALILCVGVIQVHAQRKTLEDVMTLELRNVGPIMKEQVVSGYYFFYKIDKAGKEKDNYLLRILDANLNEVGNTKVQEAHNVELEEAAYDGKYIMLSFVDEGGQQTIFYKFDENATLLFRKTIELPGRPLRHFTQPGEISNKNLVDLTGRGFISYTSLKDREYDYQIRFFPNSGDQGWVYQSSRRDELSERASFLAAGKEVLYSYIFKSEDQFHRSETIHLSGTDLRTGKQIFEYEFTDRNYKMRILSAFADSSSQNLSIFGLYYDSDSDLSREYSNGLFAITIDNQGYLVTEKFISWNRDIEKLIPEKKRDIINNDAFITFHKILKLSDGNIYAVGEQFRKRVAGPFGEVKLILEDLVIFEFTPDFKLLNVRFFDKSHPEVQLKVPIRAAYGNTAQMLGEYAKRLNEFDYAFTQINQDHTAFSVGYLERVKNKSHVFHLLNHVDGQYSTDKINLELEGSTLRVVQGKPEYVLILERINY